MHMHFHRVHAHNVIAEKTVLNTVVKYSTGKDFSMITLRKKNLLNFVCVMNACY